MTNRNKWCPHGCGKTIEYRTWGKHETGYYCKKCDFFAKNKETLESLDEVIQEKLDWSPKQDRKELYGGKHGV